MCTSEFSVMLIQLLSSAIVMVTLNLAITLTNLSKNIDP